MLQGVIFFFINFEQLVLNEQDKLNLEPTKEEKICGIEKLSIFGSFSTIHNLSVELSISFDLVKTLQYSYVFLIQWQKIEQIKFQRRLAEYHKSKNQQNGKH